MAAKTATATTPAPTGEPTTMRINLHVLVDVDPARWTAGQDGDDAGAARAELVKVLVAGGYDEAAATAMADKIHQPATATGPAAVRESVKEYVLAEMRKLAKMTAAGAEIAYYERPVKEA